MKNFLEKDIRFIYVGNVNYYQKKNDRALNKKMRYSVFLEQSNISKKNISRLKVLASSENDKIAEYAKILLEIAYIVPHKKRRLKILAKERKDLLQRLNETGLIFAHHI